MAPKRVLFSKDHTWVSVLEDRRVRIGITSYAQDQLHGVVFLSLPEAGEAVTYGEKFGEIEGTKTVADLLAPVTGRIVQVNEEVMDEPERISAATYQSWLVEVEIESLPEDLMDSAAYKKYLEQL